MLNPSHPQLNLLVLRSSNLDGVRDFYETLLDVRFVPERHGNGPEHFARTIGPMTLELYPFSEGEETNPTLVRLGFAIADLDGTLATLRARSIEFNGPKDSPWGRRALLKDPDGRTVELTTLVGND